MVHANGRIYFVQGRSDAVRATDGGPPVATGLQADELRVSEDGRYLGALETSTLPWSTVIVDLESGRVVVRWGRGLQAQFKYLLILEIIKLEIPLGAFQ